MHMEVRKRWTKLICRVLRVLGRKCTTMTFGQTPSGFGRGHLDKLELMDPHLPIALG